MKKIRKANEDLAEMLNELKVGDDPIFDAVSLYEITKVPSGFIYKNEYTGCVFVPYAPKEQPKKEAVIIPPPIKPTMEEKKVTKPARKAVTK